MREKPYILFKGYDPNKSVRKIFRAFGNIDVSYIPFAEDLKNINVPTSTELIVVQPRTLIVSYFDPTVIPMTLKTVNNVDFSLDHSAICLYLSLSSGHEITGFFPSEKCSITPMVYNQNNNEYIEYDWRKKTIRELGFHCGTRYYPKVFISYLVYVRTDLYDENNNALYGRPRAGASVTSKRTASHATVG